MLEQTLGQVLSGQHSGANAAGMPMGQHPPGQVMPETLKPKCRHLLCEASRGRRYHFIAMPLLWDPQLVAVPVSVNYAVLWLEAVAGSEADLISDMSLG